MAITPPSERRRSITSAYDAPIMRALAKDPARRTPDAATFRRELLEARGDTPSPRRPAIVAPDDPACSFGLAFEHVLVVADRENSRLDRDKARDCCTPHLLRFR